MCFCILPHLSCIFHISHNIQGWLIQTCLLETSANIRVHVCHSAYSVGTKFVSLHIRIFRIIPFRVWELYFTYCCLPILSSSNVLIWKLMMKGSVFCVSFYCLTFCVFWSHFLNFGKLNIQFLSLSLSLALYIYIWAMLLNEFAHTGIQYLHYENKSMIFVYSEVTTIVIFND